MGDGGGENDWNGVHGKVKSDDAECEEGEVSGVSDGGVSWGDGRLQ